MTSFRTLLAVFGHTSYLARGLWTTVKYCTELNIWTFEIMGSYE